MVRVQIGRLRHSIRSFYTSFSPYTPPPPSTPFPRSYLLHDVHPTARVPKWCESKSDASAIQSVRFTPHAAAAVAAAAEAGRLRFYSDGISAQQAIAQSLELDIRSVFQGRGGGGGGGGLIGGNGGSGDSGGDGRGMGVGGNGGGNGRGVGSGGVKRDVGGGSVGGGWNTEGNGGGNGIGSSCRGRSHVAPGSAGQRYSFRFDALMVEFETFDTHVLVTRCQLEV
jgi:hypothetical protein